MTTLDWTEEDYKAAVKVCRDMGRISVSAIQRHLRMGYVKAWRIVDEMGRRGDAVLGENRAWVLLPAPVTPAPCTLTQFRAVLIRHCVIGYDAIADGEHYDGGRTLKATAAAFEEIRAMMGGQAV